MAVSQIEKFEEALQGSWPSFGKQLADDFSVAALIDACQDAGYGVSSDEWSVHLSKMPLTKSRVKIVHAANDDEIVELTEVELDYVVGGAAAVPVLAVAIAVATTAAVVVSVAAIAWVVVGAGASIVAWATVYAWGGNGSN